MPSRNPRPLRNTAPADRTQLTQGEQMAVAMLQGACAQTKTYLSSRYLSRVGDALGYLREGDVAEAIEVLRAIKRS